MCVAKVIISYVIGRGLELQHLRWNSECEVYEELPPIDLNLNYDFNFQQTTYLPREVTVLPVSEYRSNQSGVQY